MSNKAPITQKIAEVKAKLAAREVKAAPQNAEQPVEQPKVKVKSDTETK